MHNLRESYPYRTFRGFLTVSCVAKSTSTTTLRMSHFCRGALKLAHAAIFFVALEPSLFTSRAPIVRCCRYRAALLLCLTLVRLSTAFLERLCTPPARFLCICALKKQTFYCFLRCRAFLHAGALFRKARFLHSCTSKGLSRFVRTRARCVFVRLSAAVASCIFTMLRCFFSC